MITLMAEMLMLIVQHSDAHCIFHHADPGCPPNCCRLPTMLLMTVHHADSDCLTIANKDTH